MMTPNKQPVTPPSLSHSDDLERTWALKVSKAKIGLFNQEQQFEPCAVSLSPYSTSKGQWLDALEITKGLNRLYFRLIESSDLMPLLKKTFSHKNNLIGKLSDCLAENARGEYNSNGVGIIRHDLMMNQSDQWKLVESNSIAAGMGPFSETLSNLLKEESSDIDKASMIENNASYSQANTLFKNAQTHLQTLPTQQAEYDVQNQPMGSHSIENKPLIVFVVAQDEDNVFDQRMLAEQIIKMGATVVFKTFEQLMVELKPEDNDRLSLNDHGIVNLFYFRTGYNLEDYEDNEENTLLYLSLRKSIDQANVKSCPSIALQLATSKWMQIQLSLKSKEELKALGNLTCRQSQLVFTALNTETVMLDNKTPFRERLKTNEWILKSQNEGGGNVRDDSTQNLMNLNLEDGWFLMKKINTKIRKESVHVLRDRKLSTSSHMISEVGIFGLHHTGEYGGYLVRTKSKDSLEVGVHRGYGMIDTLRYL